MLSYRAWRDGMPAGDSGASMLTITIPLQLADAVDEDDEDDCPGRLHWLALLSQLVEQIATSRELELGEPYLRRCARGEATARRLCRRSLLERIELDRLGRTLGTIKQAAHGRSPRSPIPAMWPFASTRDPAPAHPDHPRARRERDGSSTCTTQA